jgi:hypothetical protein
MSHFQSYKKGRSVPLNPKALRRVYNLLIIVAAQSKAWTVFALSNTGILGSNLTRDMDVCVRLYYVCAVLCVQVAALRLADPPSKESCRL